MQDEIEIPDAELHKFTVNVDLSQIDDEDRRPLTPDVYLPFFYDSSPSFYEDEP